MPELPQEFLEEVRVRWKLLAYVASVLFLKSIILDGYIVSILYAYPDVRTALREWIPFLSIYLAFVAVVVAPALLFRNRGYHWYLILLNLVVSTIFLIDLWYYRAFARFASIHHIGESANLRNLSSAVLSFVHPSDFLLLLDAFTLVVWLSFSKQRHRLIRPTLLGFVLFLGLPAGYLFYFNETRLINEESLFAFRWFPLETISTMSPIGYHLYDLVVSWKERKQIELTSAERNEIRAWYDNNKERMPPNRYKGLFRGNNLILLQCESLENFVIGKSVNGQEITPTLNRLTHASLYFRNFLQQVGDGWSSDAEFMANTSVYPLRSGSVAWRYPLNTYNSLPRLLAHMGYHTFDIHPDPGAYWNWAQMMAGVGIQECIDARSFVHDDLIELGLSDGSFLKQAAPMIMKLKRPFYVYMITLSNHVPYDLPARYRELQFDAGLDESEVGGYLQSVHYTDRHIGLFLSLLDDAGLLENTVVGLFGDHCGIHKFSLEDLARIPEGEKKWMENGMRIPLILYKKGMTGEVIDTIGGQIDILPTIAYLMGVESSEFEGTAMGRNLLNTRKNFAVLYDGEYIAPQNNEPEMKRARHGLELADKMIRSNYFK